MRRNGQNVFMRYNKLLNLITFVKHCSRQKCLLNHLITLLRDKAGQEFVVNAMRK